MKKIRFIINPISGIGQKGNLPELIEKTIDKSKYEYEVCFTEATKHATELSAEAVSRNYDIVVAVGGDGSVNETAQSLINSNTALGIIPTGSGNGMARHLKIPINVVKALELLNTHRVDSIDTISVNNHFCIGTIGIGFDGYIAHLFSKAPKRGYSTYVKLVLTEFSTFKEKKFSILADGKLLEKNCFLLTFSNSSQFGNNAVIAPFADVKDGIIDISMISRFPAISAPSLIYRLMRNTIHGSKYFSRSSAREIIVKNNIKLEGHIDGEPVIFNSDLVIKMNALSLNVVVPE